MADISKFNHEGSGTVYNLKDAQARAKLETVSNKADSNEARINNLIVSSGSDSSAEVIDARVGYDNTTYSNLGTAIRTQVNNLNEGVVTNYDIMKNNMILDAQKTFSTFDSDKVPTKDGTLKHYDQWVSTGFQKIPLGATMMKFCGDSTMNGTYAYVYALAFYDKNKKFIKGMGIEKEGNLELEDTLPIPDGVTYYVLSKSLLPAFPNNKYAKFFNKKLADMNERMDNIELNFKDINIEFEQFYKNESPIVGGGFSTFEGWYRSDYIKCLPNKNIKYTGPYNIGANITPIAFYDENKQYLLAVPPTGRNEGVLTGDIITPENCAYFIVSSVNTQFLNAKGSASYRKQYDLEKIEKIEKIALSNINVLCIGDSLTAGDYGSDPAGTANVHDENYPFYLNKYTDWEAVNAGMPGFTSKMYWENKIKTIDFSQAFDTILIMLGTNGGLTDTLDDDTTGDNYNNYADSNTGDYCKIIEYCHEKKPQAQIFLITPPHVGTKREDNRKNVETAYPMVLKIASKYNLPVIDLYKESGFSDMTQDLYQPIDHLHFGKLGYQKMATFIANQVKSKLSVCNLD